MVLYLLLRLNLIGESIMTMIIFCILGWCAFLHPMHMRKQHNEQCLHAEVTENLLNAIIDEQVKGDFSQMTLFKNRIKYKEIVAPPSGAVVERAQQCNTLHSILLQAQREGEECYEEIALLYTCVMPKSLLSYVHNAKTENVENQALEKSILDEFCSSIKRYSVQKSSARLSSLANQCSMRYAGSRELLAKTSLKKLRNILCSCYKDEFISLKSLMHCHAYLNNVVVDHRTAYEELKNVLDLYQEKESIIDVKETFFSAMIWSLLLAVYNSQYICEGLMGAVLNYIAAREAQTAEEWQLEELQQTREHALTAYKKFFKESYKASIVSHLKDMLKKEMYKRSWFEFTELKKFFITQDKNPFSDIILLCCSK